MQYKGLTLDKFQVDAITSIENNHSVVVSSPTGSGKTLIADHIINKYINKKTVIYTAPIKALSNQKYKEFSTEYGKEKIGLVTGDITINPSAPIVIMTTEIYRNMAISKDPKLNKVAYVVFDEIHFINDVQRGYVWEESIIFSGKQIRFLCLSATIPNAKEFSDWISAIKGHTVDTVINDNRPVPLYRKFFNPDYGITTLEDIRKKHEREKSYFIQRKNQANPKTHIELISLIKDQLPCFFFTFSRRRCQENALELVKSNMFKANNDINKYVRQKLYNAPPEINKLKSVKDLRQVLPYGVGFHHAGLLPIIKELVEELFSKGLIKVLYTTETFAVGINMPAKSVCFDSMKKFDGINFRYLNSKEYFQIAGRAGRRGIDKVGFAYAVIDMDDFNYSTLKNITENDTDPIKSQFRLSVNTVLNLIKLHNTEEIKQILCKNFNTYQKYGKKYNTVKTTEIYRNYNNLYKKLESLGYIKNSKLTEKGNFSTKIYYDEIAIGEIFATKFYKTLTEYDILLIIAALAYENKPKDEFFNMIKQKSVKTLTSKIKSDPYLKTVKQFSFIEPLTAVIYPCYKRSTIFEIIDNTNLLEGDVICLFRQTLDIIGQIINATDDLVLKKTLKNCENKIDSSMEDIDII